MTLVNIAQDDTKPLFVDPADITALQVVESQSGTELIIYHAQGVLLHAKLQSWNLDVADVVQKLENSGVSLLPLTTREHGKEHMNYIVPSAVTFATVSLPIKNGMAGAIIGVKGACRIETWEGGTTQSEIDNLIDAVRKTKTLFEYKPEDAYSRWCTPAALYIDPASVIRMEGSFDYNQINILFEDSGSRLDVQVAYHNELSPKTSLKKKARDIYNQSYTGAHQGIAAIDDIVDQLKKEAVQARVDFVNKIAAANGNLLNISTQEQAAFLRKEDIGTVSFNEAANNGVPGLCVRSKEKHGKNFEESFSLQFNTAAEQKTVLAILNKAKSKPDLKP